ncbi:MAG: hypothetical protein WCP86_00215 [bacterium]
MSAVSSLILRSRFLLLGAGREMKRHSLFKTSFIALFVVGLTTGLFFLFLSGFRFLGQIGPLIISSLLSLFFLGLGSMLAISSILTSYATIYRSNDIPFLLARPYSTSEIVVYKFLESCLLSSWAFFFVVVPFIGAYAWYQHLSLLFALWTFLFSIPFVIFCSGIGALITILFVRWTPRGHLYRVLIAFLFMAIVVATWMTVHDTRQADNPSIFILSSRLVPGLHLASSPLLPSWWVAEGITSLGRGAWARGLLLLAFLSINAVMLTMLVEVAGRWTFFAGWQKVIGASGRIVMRKPLLQWLESGLFFLPHDVRAIAVKDMRTFLRDPMQWSQFLLFFGLLGIYFSSLRSFRYDEQTVQWKSAIAFLNIFSVSTVLCSLASRFVYPQVSLEGQSFWVLGLSPTSMGRILATKFSLALAGMAVISITLMFLSTRMLRLSGDMQFTAIALAACLSVAISGMSTGVGAIFLDLKERNPAAIVSGFGGTLNLVLSLGFMLSTVLPFAVLFHLNATGRVDASHYRTGLVLGHIWLFSITAIAGTLPLLLGRRSLSLRDY